MFNKINTQSLFYSILLVFVTTELIVTAGQLISGYNLSYVKGTTTGFVEFSLCLAMCMPALLHLTVKLFARKKPRWFSRTVGGVTLLYLICIAAIIIASRSRASWVAAIMGGMVVGFFHLSSRLNFHLRVWHKIALLLLPALLAGAFYSIKKDSADGRMLIWKITVQELTSGNITLLPREDNFSAFIGQAQEEYFSAKERPWQEQKIAGSPDDAYNEYLQILVEDGLVAFMAVLLLLLLLANTLRKSREETKVPLAGSFVAIVILTFFSYPLRCTTSLTLAVVFLITCGALALRQEKTRIVSLCFAYIGVICWFAYQLREDRRLERALDQSRHIEILCNSKVTDNLLRCYYNLFPFLNDKPEYIIAYSKALLDQKKYKRCIKMLHQAKHLSGDPVFPIVEGKCMEQQKLYADAERLYLKAYYRVPHRIYPLYLLMSMYRDQGRIGKAKVVAAKISRIRPKIPSAEFSAMQDSARVLMSLR